MSFQGFYTIKGRALAAKLAAGTKLTITKVTAGSGETAKTAAALAGEMQTLTAGTAAVSSQSAVLPVTLAETDVSAAYSLTELGVYAQDPDAGEILFQVFRLDKPVSLTAGGENAYRFYLKQTVGAAGITVTCSPAGLLTDEDIVPLRTALAKKPDAVLAATALHVAKTGSDTTGDGSAAKPFLTIGAALQSLPKLLVGSVTVTVHEGTYDEAVSVSGFGGGGILEIKGETGKTVSVRMIAVRDNAHSYTQLTNLTISGSSGDGYNWSVFCDHTSPVYFSNITCANTVAAQYYGAFRFSYMPFATLEKVTVSNKAIALDVCAATVYLRSAVTGTGNTVAIRCGSAWGNGGGIVQKGECSLEGEEQKGYGGQIW